MPGGSGPTDDLKLHLNVLSEEHLIEARVRVGPTKLMEILPLARAIGEAVIAIALARVKAQGRVVSCRPGCGACCRQAVPISPLEAIRLAEVVEAMPEARRRAVERRFAEAVARLEKAGLFDPAAPPGRSRFVSAEPLQRDAWREASRRYFPVGVPCPFLEDESCSIHAERPMVCREYHVTSPASRCATLGPGLETTPAPIRMSEILGWWTNVLLRRDDYAIPLVLSLEWARANRATFDQVGDGAELAAALVRVIQAADDEAAAEQMGGFPSPGEEPP